SLRRDVVDPPNAPVYFDGHPAIVLGVSILEGINSVEFGNQLKAEVIAIEQTLPWGFVLDFATFQPDLVESAVGGATNNLYQTLGIVLAITILFLGLRTGLIVGAFVPFTMLVGIIFMRMFEVELQRVSIAALIISLGMLVDNGIVVAEDIRVRMAQGVDRVKAAIEAGRSLALPLLTSSLTTILFFVPMALAEGGAGEYTQSLAQVVTIVLLASWFLAMFMTPAVSVWFLKAPKQSSSDPHDTGLYRGYKKLLESVLKKRGLFLIAMVLLLVGSGILLTKVEKEFFPLGERNQFLIYLDLPAGTSTRKTDEVVQRLVRWLSDEDANPEIASNVAYVSSGGPRFFLSLAAMDPDPHRAFSVVNTFEPAQVDAVITRTRQYLLEAFPEARGEAKKMWMGASEAGLYEVRLVGPDDKVLMNAADKLLDRIGKMPGILSAKQDWENPVIKLHVQIDQARARSAGLTSQVIANTLQSFLSGSKVTDYREAEQSIPVVIRTIASERGTLTSLQAQGIYSQALDTWVPLIQVADISGEWQIGRVKRRDQARTLTLSAKHAVLGAGDLHSQLLPVLDALDLPPGHRWEIGGEIEKQAEANGRLFANLPLAFALIVLLLVWQFNSVRRAGVILMTIPLILVGATLGLVIMQAPFGFMVILGFFSLAGIIINNGIVLIDRIDQEERAGKTSYSAIIDASLSRLRPILLTSLTTVLGLLPLIISQDPLFYGMASAMAFGLAVGTVLTLCVVPALYAVLYRVKTI
ncbi:MAG: efflux RND transporter permease subunit, partial [Proteobacteria bacterium]|nr:efflux RND transporter permease subunit [Pseudomonadota bacterium]